MFTKISIRERRDAIKYKIPAMAAFEGLGVRVVAAMIARAKYCQKKQHKPRWFFGKGRHRERD